MAASLKAIMQCLDIDTSGSVSILGDFFGFLQGELPNDPDPGADVRVSVLDQVRACQGAHVNLNVIRVGFDVLTNPATALNRLDFAILRTRQIFAQVGLGVGRVLHWEVSADASDGADNLSSVIECDGLIADWSVDNDGIDAFVVRNISSDWFVGKASAIPGNCDKGTKNDGVCAGEIGRPGDEFARTFAHEIGHHLGLRHNHLATNCPDTISGRNNLMAQSRCAQTIRGAVLLRADQGETMRDHCSVRPGC